MSTRTTLSRLYNMMRNSDKFDFWFSCRTSHKNNNNNWNAVATILLPQNKQSPTTTDYGICFFLTTAQSHKKTRLHRPNNGFIWHTNVSHLCPFLWQGRHKPTIKTTWGLNMTCFVG
jgi:hypothetical protein